MTDDEYNIDLVIGDNGLQNVVGRLNNGSMVKRERCTQNETANLFISMSI